MASAHAQLVSSSPADGSTLFTAPTQVVLTFNEAISTSFAIVKVTGPGGGLVSQGSTAVSGAEVTQTLKPSLGAGAYTVAYRVVSADGHPVSEALHFTIEGAASSAPSSSSTGAVTSTRPTAPATTGQVTRDGVAIPGNPAGIFESRHLAGFVTVGALVLGALGLLVLEARRRRS